jgi:hypothetical protein
LTTVDKLTGKLKIMRNVLLASLFIILNSFVLQQDNRTANFPGLIERVEKIPEKNKVWVFILAGQSNMAGRGLVEPQDTIQNKRILTINEKEQLIYAKEPLHFYEPTMAGLDCGLSFGKTLLRGIPSNISVLLIPAAVGGSSISQWLGDSVHRKVKLLTNFKEKVEVAKKYGTIKAVLWHQGESDANKESIPLYDQRLSSLFDAFRRIVQNSSLPIVVGELGSYSDNKQAWAAINQIIREHAAVDPNIAVVSTGDLINRGDKIHFNSEGQRKLGERYAQAYLNSFKK